MIVASRSIATRPLGAHGSVTSNPSFPAGRRWRSAGPGARQARRSHRGLVRWAKVRQCGLLDEGDSCRVLVGGPGVVVTVDAAESVFE